MTFILLLIFDGPNVGDVAFLIPLLNVSSIVLEKDELLLKPIDSSIPP